METNFCPEISIHRGIDLHTSRNVDLDLSFLPPPAFTNCNGLVLSIIQGKDIQERLDLGANPDGITDKCPFMSPLVWVGLMNMFDWEKEKTIVRKMLLSKIDCNYIGLCGFNLFHFYLVQSLFTDIGFQKLKWWVDKPMVDCNSFLLHLCHRPHIRMLHPAQLVSEIVSHHPHFKKKAEQTIQYLLSRGMSSRYLDEEWQPLTSLSTHNKHLKQRIHKQTSSRKTRFKPKEQCLPTPQMNNIQDIPHDQHMIFCSPCGLSFRFHPSYMDTILKTHRFPFTMEPIRENVLRKWIGIFEKKWMPREEFVMTSSSPCLCEDSFMKEDSLFIHLLHNWVLPIYPYTRMIMLSTFPMTERMYEYMCMKMRTGMFHLPAFHKTNPPTMSWKHYFLWASYDSIQEFLFASQMEELISQLEIFYSWTKPFTEEYPDPETFILINSINPTVYNIYSEEFDCTMYQVYYMFKKMAMFNRTSTTPSL